MTICKYHLWRAEISILRRIFKFEFLLSSSYCFRTKISVISAGPRTYEFKEQFRSSYYYDEFFCIFFPTVFLKNIKYRSKLREITMNCVRLNFSCLNITLQKFFRHCFLREPRVRCILYQWCVLWRHLINSRSHELQKYTEWIHLVYRWITRPNEVLILATKVTTLFWLSWLDDVTFPPVPTCSPQYLNFAMAAGWSQKLWLN